ncbi:glycosyltransferase [Methylobacterium segetis]|uniref:glycosyltransferase n=1 Tax=Methylobacterium segetis TaxID=2488750 RepID=UPI001FE23FA2|nr:glycosyltransferase [Methylobacterium segetis]
MKRSFDDPSDGVPEAAPPGGGGRPAHGIAGWPGQGQRGADARPDSLPDGRPWPRLRIVTVSDGTEEGLADTLASVLAQGYPEARHDVLPPATLADGAFPDAGAADHVLILRAGDMLAPGALTALALEAALTGAAAVAGLRVLYDAAVTGLDAPSLDAGFEDDGDPQSGGEILFASSAFDGRPTRPAELWARLAAMGAPLVRIGRPVLLQRDSAAPEPIEGLSIVSLTGAGHRGGAGIAQRRLGEALRLSGHRVAQMALTDESPPAAAEWTDAFPGTEATIRQLGPDLVIAGNLHGATRSLDILGRLGATARTALVLHDLFPLTGRCAYPKGCTRIAVGCDAACPTPDEYPQLRRNRIPGLHVRKRSVLGAPGGPLLLANSRWTAERARDYAPPATRVAQIALAFPTGVFAPGDRAALRRRLGLPADDVLVMFSAVIVDAPDKGVADLVDALRRVARPGIGFVAVGRLDDPARLGLPNLHAPGPIGEEAELAAWYGACDLHVTASRLETLGQTPIEAGLCGTPTLAYRATGLTTAVIDGVTGRLVPEVPGALAAALDELVSDGAARRRLGAFARIALENRFSYAAASMSIEAALATSGILPRRTGRPRFAPEMLARFDLAADRHGGEGGTVDAPSPPLVRRLRQAKHALLGRNLPFWARRSLYLATRLRGALRRRGINA